jgi:hypothetical protein
MIMGQMIGFKSIGATTTTTRKVMEARLHNKLELSMILPFESVLFSKIWE